MNETDEKDGPRGRMEPVDIDKLIGEDPHLQAVSEEQRVVVQAAQLIRELREAAGLNQRDLASLAGTSQAHVSELERANGRQGPTVELLARLVAACGEQLVLAHASLLGKLIEARDEGERIKAKQDDLRREIEQLRRENTKLRRESYENVSSYEDVATFMYEPIIREIRKNKPFFMDVIKENYNYKIRSSEKYFANYQPNINRHSFQRLFLEFMRNIQISRDLKVATTDNLVLIRSATQDMTIAVQGSNRRWRSEFFGSDPFEP